MWWLKTKHIYYLSSGNQKSEMSLTGLKAIYYRAPFNLDSLGENLFSCLFQLLEVTHTPWLVGPSIFTASNHIPLTSASIVIHPSLTRFLLPPSFTFKGPL